MLCWSNQVGAHKVTRENMRERREGEVWGRARHCFEARRDGVLAKRQGGRKSLNRKMRLESWATAEGGEETAHGSQYTPTRRYPCGNLWTM